MFEDREEAGRLLAEALSSQNLDIDTVLLTSLGSFPVGRKVASALDAELDTMISRELTAPGKRVTFGAVSERNTVWLDDAMVEEFRIGERYVSDARQDKLYEIEKTLEALGLCRKPDLKSKRVAFVSSGIASGMKEAASLGAGLREGSSRRIMVSPFISETGFERMSLADEVISLETPRFALSSSEAYSTQNTINRDEIRHYFRA